MVESVALVLQEIFDSEHLVLDALKISLITNNCVPVSHIPACVVYPVNKEQIQKTLILANQSGIGVWVVSRGKNWGYGSKSPHYQGGILMVLEKMNRILEVNETLGYAVIEAGVSYAELNDYLKKIKSRLWIDPTGSTESGSVIGNALDKGRGITPYADHFGHLCGLEVILPTGEILKPDGGADHYQARYSYRWGLGPVLSGLFVQSNLGVVISSGIWLMPKPEKYEFMTFEYTSDSNKFPAFLDTFRELMFKGQMTAFPHIANDYAMLCIVDQHPKKGLALSDLEIQDWRKRHGVSNWTFGCGLYGDRSQVKNQKNKIKKALKPFGVVHYINFFYSQGLFDIYRKKIFSKFAQFFLRKSEAVVETLDWAHQLYQGNPTDFFVKQAYCLQAQKPAGVALADEDECGVIWVGPILPFEGKRIQDFLIEAKDIFKQHQFDFFAEVMPTSPRSVIILMGIFYDKKNPQRTEQALNWFKEFHLFCDQKGYPPYRETLMGLDQLFQENPQYLKTIQKIKTALDPKGIFSKGRTGKTDPNP